MAVTERKVSLFKFKMSIGSGRDILFKLLDHRKIDHSKKDVMG